MSWPMYESEKLQEKIAHNSVLTDSSKIVNHIQMYYG